MNRNGRSITANTASEPPTTYAAQRRRAANPASGMSSSAAIATAPARVNTSGARLYDVSEWTTSWLPYCSNARCSSSASGDTERVSFTIGRSQSMKSAAGTTSAPSASPPARTSARSHNARTTRKPTNGIQRKIAYVGCTTASTNPAAAVEATSPSDGERTDSSASASAAGTRSWRDDVAGSERNTYAPPIPGAKAIIATCAAAGHAGRPRPPEERPAGLEGDENRERREDRREVRDDPLRILARDLRDQRDEAVPERERVAGVQAAVGELGDPLERQVVELEQLPRTREVEETVTLHRRRRDPQEHADDRAPEERPGTPRNGLGGGPAPEAAEHGRGDGDENEQHERQRQGRAEREGDRERPEHGHERPREARRHAAHAERSREQPPGREDDRGGERELEVEDEPSAPEQRGRVTGREPRRAVAVRAPTLAAEDEPAKAKRREEQAARALGLLRAAVLPEEEQMAAEVLAVEATAVRRAAHVHALGAGEEDDLPAGLAEPVAPVRLLAEEEVVLVALADLRDRLAPQEHARAHDDLDLAHLVVVEAARVERVQRRRARRELAQEEVLGREPPEGRVAANRALQRPVRVEEPRADDRGARARVGEVAQPLERAVERATRPR